MLPSRANLRVGVLPCERDNLWYDIIKCVKSSVFQDHIIGVALVRVLGDRVKTGAICGVCQFNVRVNLIVF